jgi:hypothetical protein
MGTIRKFPFVISLIGIFLLMSLSLGLVWAKPKCDTPPCKDDGGDSEPRDLPANADFWGLVGDAIFGDGLAYIDGQERVNCFIGRTDGQFVLSTSNKRTSGRMIWLDSRELIPSETCGDFGGWRVAEMNTARIDYGGVDLRLLTGETKSALSLNVYEDRRNLWHIRYENVSVKPFFDEYGNLTRWDIVATVECENWEGDCSQANVRRIVNNQYADAIECGPISLPFQLTVDLQ